MKREVSAILLALGLGVAGGFGQAPAPFISEFMASNRDTLEDVDGDFPDWIEIANESGGAIDLAGHFLTDNPANPTKWRFPSVVLDAGSRLVVFASNKDRVDPAAELHTNFELDADGGYLALVGPDGATVLSAFEDYPPQFADESFGAGIAGSVTVTDMTPAAWQVGTNLSNVFLNGTGGGTDNTGANSLDNGTGDRDVQRYLWIDFSEKLAAIPAAERRVLSAVMRWEGKGETQVTRKDTVDSRYGIFSVPDANHGIDTIGAVAGSAEIVDYYASTTPWAEVLIAGDGTSQSAAWDLTALVQSWIDQAGAPQRGQVMLLNAEHPTFVRWNIVSGTLNPDVRFLVQTTDAASIEPVAIYFDAPTPGAPNVGGTLPGPLFGEVTEDPPQPEAGPLTVTAQVAPIVGAVDRVDVFYRHMFDPEVRVAMRDDGQGGDAVAADGTYTAVIPGSAVLPGRMVRWRFEATDADGNASRLPAFRNPADSDQYFGTVPADAAIRTRLPVFHWFIPSIGPANTDAGARGAIYYLGEFYDNVHFSIHGQSTRGSNFPKKSYNIDFNRTKRFRWDETGEAPRVKDINLLNNWADKSKVRHVLAYEVMRNAGVKAHFAFTVRVQHNGEFYTTADLVEDPGDRWLERVGLNEDGALYKVYDNQLNKDLGDTGRTGVEKKNREWDTTNQDLQALIDGLDLTGVALERYLFDHIDLPGCVNMLAANSVIRNIDMHRKNWYIYQDSDRTNEWTLLPWDLDLTFGRRWIQQYTYFDNDLFVDGYVQTGTSVRLVQHLFSNPKTRGMIMRRIRTLCDLYLQPPNTPYGERYLERRLDEQLALIDPPDITPSDARLDFEKWGSWLQGGTRVPYTNTSPLVEDMREGVDRWKNEYLPGRRNYIYNQQLVGRGGQIPANAQSADPSPAIQIGTIEFSPASGNQDEEFIQLTNPLADDVDVSDWQLTGAVEFALPPGTVVPAGGSLYVVPDKVAFRSRSVSPKAGEGHFVVGPYKGHLSSLGETIVLVDQSGVEVASKAFIGDPSDAQRYLRISEIMYHPATHEDAEFVELVNISDAVTLDLTGVRFVAGIEFDFSTAAVTTLAPGGRLLLVKDRAVFESIYGAVLGNLIAGEFANGTRLSNGGEELDLEDATGSTIAKFSYRDTEGWPLSADGGGFSLVLANPATDPDPGLGESWRASLSPGGSPGRADSGGFSGDPLADADGDGIADIVEWATSPGSLTDGRPLQVWIEHEDAGGGSTVPHLMVRLTRNAVADGVVLTLERSGDLSAWNPAGDAMTWVRDIDPGDGTIVSEFRSKSPVVEFEAVRLRVDYTAP